MRFGVFLGFFMENWAGEHTKSRSLLLGLCLRFLVEIYFGFAVFYCFFFCTVLRFLIHSNAPLLFALIAREVSRSYLTLSHKTVNDSKDFVTEGRYNKNKVLLTMRIKQSEFTSFRRANGQNLCGGTFK